MKQLQKTYATKKSAQAAARKQYGANYSHHSDIEQHDEGFWVIVAKVDYANSETSEPQTEAEKVAEMEGTAPAVSDQATVAEIVDNPMSYTVCPECGSTELYAGRNISGVVMDEDKVIGCHHCDWEYEVPKPSMLGSLFGNMTGEIPVPPVNVEKPAAPKTTGLTIEKDRPEQNGVKRPSAGGMCRAVWDACWSKQSESNEVPTAKWVKEKAVEMGWNPNNASIEYYQWRKFNGISGRVAAPKPAVEPAADAAAVEPQKADAENAESNK